MISKHTTRRFLVLSLGLSLSLFSTAGFSPAIAQSLPIDFQREIQPLLADHCLHCHGADPQTRQGGLRLDQRDSAIRGGDSGSPAIVERKAEASLLVTRIRSSDPEQVMPPPSSKKPLNDQQKLLLERWIQEGGEFASHWAFSLPKPTLPEAIKSHPIDHWVQAEKEKRSLPSSPRETDNLLCRRLYLDLIGLPPTLEELSEFRQAGFEATVDKLLKSERFGEKWARHWLDVARYSDTNGYEKDLRRDQWAWRDWVVDAFNVDMPFNQFLVEQIAGDLLPNATQSQWIATGFLRNSMLNEEGAIIPEQFRMFEQFDRMDCIGKAVLGMTTQCAQCHNHKFDPLTQNEYYGMLGFINNAYEAQSWVYTPEQKTKREEVLAKVKELHAQIRTIRPQWKEELTDWANRVKEKEAKWTPVSMHQLESISGLNHPVQLDDQSILMLGHTSGDIFFVGKPDLEGVTGLRLEILPHDDLPFRGPGRSEVGSWDILEVETWIQLPGKSEWEKQKLVQASADFSEPEQKGEGKKSTGPVGFLIDGTDETKWQADRGEGQRNQASVAVLQFEKPLSFPSGTQFKFVMRMGKMVGCCRVSLTNHASPVASPIDYQALLAIQSSTPIDDENQIEPFYAWSKSLAEPPAALEELKKVWSQYPKALTSVFHLKEREGPFQRVTHRLDRGEWDQKKEPIVPHTPSFLHPLQGEGKQTRLDFARWLASDQSPLTSRVAVNRVWQAIFGEGLVETAEDFGTRAPVPEHLPLLDWLAADFVRTGWSQKNLIRTIVTSQTYQQSSRVSAELLEKDPKNRWLTRGPRFRCEAEVVRDIALAASGLMKHQRGGPSVIPPVPQNVLDYNYVYPSYWTPAQGPERYRRSLYMFRKRSMPDPVMSNLDAPNGDMACARRIRSNTPLAALTGLNEIIFVEAAQALAIKVLQESGPSDELRIDHGYQLCTSRLPTSQEKEAMLAFIAKSRKRIADGWVNAREIATGTPDRLPTLPPGVTPQDAAAWTLTSRVLLNLDETISKN